ncbi:hypothetical protein J6590_045964 [Homalodisca vitripennis]|nr:hypothetical protein J6590_045964 [Homalodisca vitripennis]
MARQRNRKRAVCRGNDVIAGLRMRCLRAGRALQRKIRRTRGLECILERDGLKTEIRRRKAECYKELPSRSSIYELAVDIHPREVCWMMDQALRKSSFSPIWKKAKLVLLKKEGQMVCLLIQTTVPFGCSREIAGTSIGSKA